MSLNHTCNLARALEYISDCNADENAAIDAVQKARREGGVGVRDLNSRDHATMSLPIVKRLLSELLGMDITLHSEL